MTAKILTIDIETQRAVVETFSLFRPFIHIDRVLIPTRVLCFAAKWRGEDKVIFKHAWDDNDQDAYLKMMKAAHDLLSEADIVITWNGDRFDIQWFEAEFVRLGLGRPTPYKSVDLIKTVKKWFKAGLMSMKLDWSSRMILGDRKVPHGGTDLWHDIRYGTKAEKAAAQKLMKQYNIHDVELTERLFEKHLPYLNINLALYARNEDGLLHCTKCNGTDLKRDGKKYHATTAGMYQMWRCKDPSCNATSRGKRMKHTTELRPV
ncbi:DnaQ-like DNA polymerase III subunit [Mycobacterium phage Inca]|nr:DnaQ-like DNA polymerase III subunit [Mycobacterium phage DoctorDiddles]AXH65769.1 DnaQ-like DNA polymerase III subunit [Mycobacterium phage Inca]